MTKNSRAGDALSSIGQPPAGIPMCTSVFRVPHVGVRNSSALSCAKVLPTSRAQGCHAKSGNFVTWRKSNEFLSALEYQRPDDNVSLGSLR